MLSGPGLREEGVEAVITHTHSLQKVKIIVKYQHCTDAGAS
jgi:hypothetical protein